MLLVVDVGNTQTHFGTFRDAELVEHWRFATVREGTADEIAAKLSGMLALRGCTFADLGSSIVSSTVPSLGVEWGTIGRRYLGHETAVIGPSLRTGMPIRIDNPRELGADRLVNAIAAYDRIQAACIVVDFGTAITYDAVSAGGEYLGGAIAPGVGISLDALVAHTAKLIRVELLAPDAVIGRSTVQAIQSGLLWGFVGQIEYVVRRMTEELGGTAHVIATGGQAGMVAGLTHVIDDVDPQLTLEGLRLIHLQNVPDGGT